MFGEIYAYLTLLNIILGIIAALAVSPLVKLIKNLYNKMKDIYTLSSRLKKLDDIHAQLLPNGGSSVRDSIDRIERKLSFNTEWIRLSDRDSGRIVFHLDANGDLEWANMGFLQLFDLELQDALGQGWLSKIERSFYLNVSQELESALDDNRDINKNYKIDSISYHLQCKILKNKNVRFGYLGIITKNAKS